ncbi:MAG: saccharopine dehydrogenase C-terminal domain-containing protein [Bacteroidales bacterium]
MQKILVLGAGLVARPLITYLLKNNFFVTVASNTPESGSAMIAGASNGKSLFCDASDRATIEKLTGEHDLTVSLLPYIFHPTVARACLMHGKPMVTTSYVKEEIAAMDEEARRKGVILLNETGLDPGIDHMSAMRIIDAVHKKGGEIKKFYSICGALPAPEYSDNPFRYKFSWSPGGVILASKNSAIYRDKGERIEIDSENLFKDRFKCEFPGVGTLEVYPNRDSISYISIYGIPEAETIYRGTFRFPGWCEALDAMKAIGLLDDRVSDYSGMSFNDFTGGLIGDTAGKNGENIAAFAGIGPDSVAMDALRWLGLFRTEDMGYGNASPINIITDLMIKKMMLGPNEKDMTVLQHLFLASYKDGSEEVISSRMVDYGSPSSDTSVARTVGLPAAIAVKLILEGKIRETGVHRPVIPSIYNPILEELAGLGIIVIEEFGLPHDRMISRDHICRD